MTKEELLRTPRTVCGCPVIDYVRWNSETLPMVRIDSDIQWVEGCIKDREEHPEKYPDEDIPEVIARQMALLKKLRQEANDRKEH